MDLIATAVCTSGTDLARDSSHRSQQTRTRPSRSLCAQLYHLNVAREQNASVVSVREVWRRAESKVERLRTDDIPEDVHAGHDADKEDLERAYGVRIVPRYIQGG